MAKSILNRLHATQRKRPESCQRAALAESLTALTPPQLRDAKIDWSLSLGAGIVAPPNMLPAEYSFEINTVPDCASDYVVFGLNVPRATPGKYNVITFQHPLLYRYMGDATRKRLLPFHLAAFPRTGGLDVV